MALAVVPNDTMSEEEDWEEEGEREGVSSLATLAGRKVFTMEGVREIFRTAGIEGFYDRLRRNHILNYFQNVTLFWKEFIVEDLDCDLANEYDDNLLLCGDGFTVWFYDVQHAPPQPPRRSAPCSMHFRRVVCSCGRWDVESRRCERSCDCYWFLPDFGKNHQTKKSLVYEFSVYNEEWIGESYSGHLVIGKEGGIYVYDRLHRQVESDGYVTNKYFDENRLDVRDIVKFVRLV